MSSSATDGEVPVYAVHDFELMNRHADETYSRVRQLTNLRRVGIYRRFALYTGALILALGIAAVLAAWAYSIAFGPPKPETRIIEIEKPVVVETQVIVRVPADATGGPTPFSELEKRLENLDLVKPGSSGTVVRNYTLFETIPYGVGGINSVVTGSRFESSKSEFPGFQYCYVELPLIGGAKKTVYIADQRGRSSTNTYNITRTLADAVGTTIGVLERAQSQCRFRR